MGRLFCDRDLILGLNFLERIQGRFPFIERISLHFPVFRWISFFWGGGESLVQKRG